ncbi:MAG TPA: sulfate permease [Anaerolineae bacterium]
MLADLGNRVSVATTLTPVVHYLRRPLRLSDAFDRSNLRSDVIAGITVAIILLPQAIAFALIAELPPQMGLYTAVVGGVVGALWGSSRHMFTGPANAISLLVLSALLNIAQPGTAEFLVAAGMLAVMAGLFQLFMGLARLGMLVNFVSHSVIVGFASGAGVLIAIGQIRPLLGLEFSSYNVIETVQGVILNLPNTHLPTAALGLATMILIETLRRAKVKLPVAPVSMALASVVVFLLGLNEQGVVVIGQLPTGLPPLADLPLFNLELIARLSTGALAVGAIGLVQAIAVARSVAAQTGQRLDSNQEFVGQGLANIFTGLFSGYACAGSFSVTAVNYTAGARSPAAAIFAGVFVLLAMLLLAPLAAFLPRTALAGVLILTAYGMVDRREIARIWRGARGDAAIMVVTLLGTIFLQIEFAVLLGILLSLALYIMRTSMPRVHAVLPDDEFRHFAYQPQKQACPQLGIVEILGDLYFGAVNHVEEFILDHAEKHPEQRFLLIRMHHVNHCDFSGIHMLENVIRTYRERGGDVFVVRANYRIRQLMEATGCSTYLGIDNVLDEDEAIGYLFHRVLDPAICIYECPVRAFKECQNLPKRLDLVGITPESEIPPQSLLDVSPRVLWKDLHNGTGARPPLVVDVREPREFKQGHIPEARLIPLPSILSDNVKLPNDRQIVFVCRSGRRSRRAAYTLQQMGFMNVLVLQGGMQAWEAEGLLEAVD